MNEAQDKALNRVLEALSFYANRAVYWGKPIDLEMELDQRTLKIAREHIDESQIMHDSGDLARDALFEFEGVFDVTYEMRSEI